VAGVGDVARDRDNALEAPDCVLERIASPRVDHKLPVALDEGTGEGETEPA
jgi:hypothetical protein